MVRLHPSKEHGPPTTTASTLDHGADDRLSGVLSSSDGSGAITRRGVWVFNMAAYLDPHGKARGKEAPRACASWSNRYAPGALGVSGESGGTEAQCRDKEGQPSKGIPTPRLSAPFPEATGKRGV